MSSSNEEVHPPPKQKTSPLEFRNTDLVSRLLAATPPYLYNMPLVPHSYFFSEMLRSLVQGKAEAASRIPNPVPHRRSRKRTWSHGRAADHYSNNQNPKMSPNVKCDNVEMPPPNWTPKLGEKLDMERPLELTMNKIPLNNNTKLCHSDNQQELLAESHKMNMNVDKPEMHGHLPMNFPPMPPNITSPETSTSSDLILPPPPPIWYPPLYPTPYGIDPLHFFIDLRVSGHIYDRKNAKEHPNLNMNIPHNSSTSLPINHLLDLNNTNSNSTITSSSLTENTFGVNKEFIKPRNTSAFTVPIPSLARNDPLNLSGNKYCLNKRFDEKPGKFDIKSMGFDSSSENRKSTNYILKNLSRIYKDIHSRKCDNEGIDLTSPKQEEQRDEEVNVKDEDEEHKEEDKNGEKEKKCKDLRALIGLELVVDYVKHEVKPGKPSISEDSTSDIDSNISSPSVEVVTLPDVENKINVL